ncbi:MAG: GTPase Era [Bacillota bacterium]|nr:GTPase Era [Bacillota bacterium]
MQDFKSGFVTIIGRPNVGKSTLLNNIIGQKIAIMSDKPQTTRNKITGVYSKEDLQIVFLDTPGIHKPKHKLGEFMVEVAQRSLNEVDGILLLVDCTQEPGKGDDFVLSNLADVTTPVILVLNKIDLLSREELLPMIDFWQKQYDFAHIVPVSALKNNNIDVLIEAIAEHLPTGPKFYPDDMVTDQPERIIVSELIREKILHRTREEIPHSIAVVIEQMEKRTGNMVFISANIYVERDSQKKIIIGKNGTLLKEVGQAARREIEALLGNKVYLDLWIKVKKDWRNHELTLKNLGLLDNN